MENPELSRLSARRRYADGGCQAPGTMSIAGLVAVVAISRVKLASWPDSSKTGGCGDVLPKSTYRLFVCFCLILWMCKAMLKFCIETRFYTGRVNYWLSARLSD